MRHQQFYPLAEASDLARKASRHAHQARQNKENCTRLMMSMQQWIGIFSLPGAIFYSLAFFLLVILDLLCMGPMYRQLSQIITGHETSIPWFIGIGFNTIGAICSHKLSKCLDGPLLDWEVSQYQNRYGGFFPADVAYYRIAQTRKNRFAGFILTSSLYVGILVTVLSMRSDLLSRISIKEGLENLLLLIGLLLSILEIWVGIYLIPMLLFTTWKVEYSSAFQRVRRFSEQVSTLDQQIYILWQHAGLPIQVTKDLKDALVRYTTRIFNENYCNAIDDAESGLMAPGTDVFKADSIRTDMFLELTDSQDSQTR